MTDGRNNVPVTENLTRFDGTTPVRDMVTLDAFFREDVIPVLAEEREYFDKLANTWPPVTYFPPLLLVVGLLVDYGLLGMFVISKKS